MLAGNGETARSYPLRVPTWSDIPHLTHGFLGRAHGLAPGPFTESDIRTQLGAAGEAPRRIMIALQVHGTAILSPETPPATSSFPTADALVSASADVLLTIRTADCVPILVVAPRARAVAAIHGGWRGAAAGIIAATVASLAERYDARPPELRAAIGPAIGPCCYEFGAEHLDKFRQAFGVAVERAWTPSSLHPTMGRVVDAHESPLRLSIPDAARSAASRVHLDLREVARLALLSTGVPPDAITIVGPCTVDTPKELHSYRRDGANAGRQLSYLGWRS